MAKSKGLVAMFAVGMVAIIAILGLLVYNQIPQTVVSGPSAAGCGVDTSTSVSAVNALSKGTSVSVGSTVKVDGSLVGAMPTTLQPGNSLSILLNATGYIDKVVSLDKVLCGSNIISTELYATSAPTIRIKNTDDNFMTDSATGGAVNQSALSAGSTNIFTVELSGVDKQSTGEMVVIVELGSSANVSSITLSKAGVPMQTVDVPRVYTKTIADGKVVAFKVPAVTGAVKEMYSLGVTLASGKVIGGATYFTVYGIQAFADTDGSFKSGVEDADGTDKSTYNADFDYFIE